MGYGSALAEVPIGSEGVREGASITVFRAPDQEGHLAMFFYPESISPVLAQLVLPGLLLPARTPVRRTRPRRRPPGAECAQRRICLGRAD